MDAIRIFPKGLLLISLAGPLQVATAQTSDADNDTAQIDEIIVTAQMREQRLQDVPMSIFTMSGENLEAANIDDLHELSYSVPGLFVERNNPFGPGIGIITIRGVGNSRGPSSLVGIYLDNSAVAGVPTSQIDLRVLDLKRVEVLRGPQGTLYGEGSVGGTIRYITNDPDLERFSAKTDFSLSSTKEGGINHGATAIVNIPVADDVFGLRISGTYENQDGWIDQPDANREDINDNKLTNFRVKALWNITESIDLTATAIQHRNDGGGSTVVNLGDKKDSAIRYAVDPTTTDTGFHDNYDLVGVNTNLDLGFATLLASTTRLETDLAFVSTQALLRPDMLEILIRRSIDNELTTHELRMTSNGEDRIDWTAGLFYRDFSTHGVTDTLLHFPLTGVTNNNTPNTLTTAESWAIYANVNFDVTDRIELGLGLRYFEEDRATHNLILGLSTSGTFDATTPRINVSYKVSDEIRLYGSVSQGFRSGGFNSFGIINSGGPPTYDPEELTAFELGAKMSLADGRIDAELALFRSDYDSIQSDGFNTEVLSNVTSNIGEAEISGIEWNFTWQPVDKLRIGFNGNIVHTEITSLKGATGTSHFIGDPLDKVPRDNYSIVADYMFDWNAAAVGSFRIALNEQGVMTRTQRASGHFSPHGYSDKLSFLNVRLGADWDHWNVSVFGDNLLDEYGYNSPTTTNQAAAQPRRRTIGFEVGYSFE